MPRLAKLLLPVCALGCLVHCPVAAAEPSGVQADERALQALGLGTDGPALLQFMRARVVSMTPPTSIAALIRQLGDDDYLVREQASADLVQVGPHAIIQLQQATHGTDIEVVRRSEKILQTIDRVAGNAVTASVLRLLAKQQPAGTAELVLGFAALPGDDGRVREEVCNTLAAVALRDGKSDSLLLAALHDKIPGRRAAAAEALARCPLAGQQPALRQLLDDPDLQVRLRVGLALVQAKDKSAMPALIQLLGQLPREQGWPIEDLLFHLAGEQGPPVTLGSDKASCQKASAAWLAWWTKHGDQVDLAVLTELRQMLGRTLILQMDNRGLTGKVSEMGPDHKPIWTIDGLQHPLDAQIVGNDHVLITEYRAKAVTERNFKGEILWKKEVPTFPVCAQRLPNGNTFIASRTQLIEIDRTGKETAINRNDILSAQRSPNGHIVVLTTTGKCVHLDARGKELKSFPVGQQHMLGSNFEVLPDGHILMPFYTNNRVVELDEQGKQVWEATANMPTTVSRLPNGNTLIGSMYHMQIVEVDKNGERVWDDRVEGRLCRVRRR